MTFKCVSAAAAGFLAGLLLLFRFHRERIIPICNIEECHLDLLV